jgi:hypothetical protein
VWVRVAGDELIITAAVNDAATEIARHRLVGRGEASIVDAHNPPRRESPERAPKATNGHEKLFLRIGRGAQRWLIEAAAAGTRQIPARMSEAVALATIHDPVVVDEALGLAATVGRFAAGDLESILATPRAEPTRPSVRHSLQPGTAAWSGFGKGGEPR